MIFVQLSFEPSSLTFPRMFGGVRGFLAVIVANTLQESLYAQLSHNCNLLVPKAELSLVQISKAIASAAHVLQSISGSSVGKNRWDIWGKVSAEVCLEWVRISAGIFYQNKAASFLRLATF